MKTTVKDIARLAKVSTTTVSLVLNHKPSRISEKTKARIFSIAKEQNYIPNMMAASLVTQKTNTIGLIVPDMENMFFNQLTIGVERYAYQLGYSVLFCHVDDQSHKCFDYLENLMRRRVDGMIIVPPIDVNKENNHVKMLDIFQKSQIPMLLLDRAVQNVFCDFVTLDNKQGGFLATEYLISLGHTKIGCITGPEEIYTGRKRLAGYYEAMVKYHLPLQEDFIYRGDFRTPSGIAGAEQLLKKGITSIFCCNDLMTLGVYQYASSMGIKIPEDVSVVGFDNLSICESLSPTLTSIDQSASLMGKRACELLIDKIEEKEDSDTPRNYYFAPTLVQRSSAKGI